MPQLSIKRLLVTDADLASLRASGLTDDTIRENGLRSDDSGIVLPYRDLNGEVNCFVRWRLRQPIGKMKYYQPKGSPVRAYFPAASTAKLRDGQSPIYITEGEKKALALSQLGLAAIGIGGVWNWKNKGSDELIDDLAAISWNGRSVFVVFDYDVKPSTRRQVDLARRRFAKALRKVGAKEVYDVDLPPNADGGKQGVDDFLVANGAEALRALVDVAQPIPDADSAPLTMPSGRTEVANARRLASRFVDVVRWVGVWNKWLIWDGRRWKIDDTLRIEALAKEVAAKLWAEISQHVATGGIDKDLVAAMVAFARISNGASGVRNMVSLARSEPGIAIGQDELDTDHWLLNVENGTIDLRTGHIRDHRQEDYITKLAPVTFDAGADCPTWCGFLARVFNGNDELIGYMQRLVGYCITGSTEEHILPFLHGTGANGKSTKVETILKLMGTDYSTKAPPDLLLAKRGEAHPTERADLHGKRFVACVETEEGRHMAEALVKELTGGDRIKARRMREDFWEFTPTHHVWLVGNHKPNIIGTDHGIWRRIKLIPFDVVIPDAEQDKKLPVKLADELPGILNWGLAGCLDWQRGGMQEPSIVRDATKVYSEEMDDIGQFIDELCELGPALMAPATELHNAFLSSFPDNRTTQKSFGAALARRGFVKARFTSGINKAKHGWKGLRLRTDGIREAIQDGIREAIKAQTQAGGVS